MSNTENNYRNLANRSTTLSYLFIYLNIQTTKIKMTKKTLSNTITLRQSGTGDLGIFTDCNKCNTYLSRTTSRVQDINIITFCYFKNMEISLKSEPLRKLNKFNSAVPTVIKFKCLSSATVALLSSKIDLYSK